MPAQNSLWEIRGISAPTLQWGAVGRNGLRHSCPHCRIILLSGEKPGFCCGPNGNRANSVPPLPPLPDGYNAFINSPDISRNSRALNLQFSFASMESTHAFPAPTGMVAVQGKVYHRVRPDVKTSAMHWLLHDGFMMGNIPRAGHSSFEELPLAWILAFRNTLEAVNPFVRAVKSIPTTPGPNVGAVNLILNDNGPSPEIAALISFENTSISDVRGRRLVISRTNNTTFRIPTISRLWEPLSYPLLFPHATLGWGIVGSPSDVDRDLLQANNTHDAATSSQMWHYRARLLREPRFQIFGRLANEYMCDMHSRDLENRLSYVLKNQQRLRAEEDAMLMGEEDVTPNENIYLPASFLGSRRWASEQVSDSLAIAAALGPPTFFITMTCNALWPEITSQLRPGQSAHDIPIVVVRVFKQKLRQLFDALKSMFPNVGAPIYMIHCIEFQKRGLPHGHILIRYGMPCDTPEFIDSVVSACLPTDPSDRAIVEKRMMHTHPAPDQPMSTYCQTELPDGTRKCRFGYPQPLQPHTTIDAEGRVHYKRVTEKDRWVVPHCLPLIRQLDCHINFEVAGTSHLFQYMFKYIHKGPDRTKYRIVDSNTGVSEDEPVNEIEEFWNARYLSAGEAAWRIMGYRLTQKDPAVSSLAIHLEDNRANLRYHRSNPEDGSLSKLERYFLRPDGSFEDRHAHRRFDDLTYAEYYTHFRLAAYDETKVGNPRYFSERSNGVNATRMHVIQRSHSNPHIARIHSVRPTQGDIFYLRVILTNRSARSFEDARTVDGTRYNTFQEAAIAMGLFADESEALYAIAEAVATLRTPRQIRVLFAHLLIHGCVSAPLMIWDQHKEHFALDFTLRNNGNVDLGADDALSELSRFLGEHGRSLGEFGLPEPVQRMSELTHEIQRWTGMEGLFATRAQETYALFNNEQKLLFDAVYDSAEHGAGLSIFVDGKAGTGKTTVIRALCDRLRSDGHVVLATATSAFAAQLYEGGRTVHSTFKVPVVEKNEMLDSPINAMDPRAELIREAALIIWDEAPMANRAVLHCVNDVLQRVMHSDKPFGGKSIVLLGDFRQTCPVIPGASEVEIVAASIKSSPLWRHFTIHGLIHPIRNATDIDFSDFVNSIGDGNGPEVPLAGLAMVQDPVDLAEFAFPGDIILHPAQCVMRSILAPTNAQVDAYNNLIMDRLEGECRTYLAADSLKEVEEMALPAPEAVLDYVRRRSLPGVPPHAVSIAVGSVCRLLRNFSIDRGLVKNVRVVVRGVGQRLIAVQVLGRQAFEEEVLIPRIMFEKTLYSGHTLVRRQFPLAPAYATTFNSCQGLTLDRIGVDLTSPVFSHGQLYTAISRVRDRNSVAFRLREGEVSTTNVTFRDLLS